MLLGGGNARRDAVLGYCTQAIPRTVVGYLSNVLAGGSGAPLPNPMDFLVRPQQTNQNLMNNLFMLCGDGNLEAMAPAISGRPHSRVYAASAAWRWVRLGAVRNTEGTVSTVHRPSADPSGT